MTQQKAKIEVQTEEVKEAKELEFTPEELLPIFDTILFEGAYKEKHLLKGKLLVEFVSLSTRDVSDISAELDTKSFNLVATMQEQRSLLSLYRGLVSYNNRDLTQAPEEKRKDFISKLPAAIVAALSKAQWKFNRKVDAACREGEANF